MSAGETPSRSLAETATERARETALAAKEKAKDLASQAQKKQYVWRALESFASLAADTGTDLFPVMGGHLYEGASDAVDGPHTAWAGFESPVALTCSCFLSDTIISRRSS